MKKLVFFIALILFVFVSSLFLVGCGSPNNNVLNNLSDIRYGVFDGKNEVAIASFVYGEREENYSPDGICNKLTDFGIITVNLKQKYDKNEIQFALSDGTKTYSGTLEKSPYNSEYLADIGEQITIDTPLTLTLSIDSESNEIILTKKSSDFQIKYEEAIDIGKKALKKEIESNNSKRLEFQLKLISQNEIEFGKYFWSFSLIADDGTKHTVVFSTSSPDILVKN